MSAIVIPFPRLNDPLHPVNREMISYYEAQGWSQEALDELLEKARSPEPGDAYGDDFIGHELSCTGVRLDHPSPVHTTTEAFLTGRLFWNIRCLLVIRGPEQMVTDAIWSLESDIKTEVASVLGRIEGIESVDEFDCRDCNWPTEPAVLPVSDELQISQVGEAYLFQWFDYLEAARWAAAHGWSISTMMDDIEGNLGLLDLD